MGPNSNDLRFYKKVGGVGAGETDQWLRLFPALAEDMG